MSFDPLKYFAIHHIDGDPTNNDVTNLRLVNVKTGRPPTDADLDKMERWWRNQALINEMKP